MSKKLEIMPTKLESAYDEKDLVTLAVAKGEEIIRKKIKEGRKELKALEKKQKELEKGFNKGFNEFKTPLIKVCDDLNATMKKYDGAFKFVLAKKLEARPDSNGNMTKEINHIIKIKNRWSHEILIDQTYPMPAKLKTLDKKIKQIDEEIQSLRSEILGEKHKLSDIPSLERQMHARIIEVQLDKTSEGKELLRQLTKETDINRTIKLLGM